MSEYRERNFSRPEPRIVGGVPFGWPFDATDGIDLADPQPTFVHCNLCNREPPAGAVIVECLTVLREANVQVDVDEVVIDGQTLSVPVLGDLVHGHYHAGAWVRIQPPRVEPASGTVGG